MANLVPEIPRAMSHATCPFVSGWKHPSQTASYVESVKGTRLGMLFAAHVGGKVQCLTISGTHYSTEDQ